ncbi:hypothetical protein [Janthinobacterium sp. RB2P8]|uniref:hypothetical protein n=1 Tax=Janthinobacterium sp. RB2P8 TaxID=3424191 RepID=UPI003F26766C
MRRKMAARGYGVARVETLAGHPGRMRDLGPHFAAFIPNGRAINPISKSNWEGIGVTPDIGVPASEALERAYQMALERLAAASADPRNGEKRGELKPSCDVLAL